MMIADLMDLEDFAVQLRTLGISIPADVEVLVLKAAVDQWCAAADAEQLQAYEALCANIREQFAGNMLPDVEALLAV